MLTFDFDNYSWFTLTETKPGDTFERNVDLFTALNLHVALPTALCVVIVLFCITVTVFWVKRKRNGSSFSDHDFLLISLYKSRVIPRHCLISVQEIKMARRVDLAAESHIKVHQQPTFLLLEKLIANRTHSALMTI